MAYSTKTVATIKNPSVSIEVKVYIRDSNRKWVDFSSRISSRQNLLSSIGNVTLSSEQRAGTRSFLSTITSIEMDNSDGFWTKPFPTNLTTTDGSTASFTSSYGGSRTALTNNWLRLTFVISDGSSVSENVGATYIIRGYKNQLMAGKTILKVESFDQALKRRDASIVKDGDTWYQNRSIDFLVRELLKLEFGAENSGDLPNTFQIQTDVSIENPDGERTLSIVGQTPAYTDTNGDGVADAFLERNLVCHAMVMAPSPANMSTGTPSDKLYLGCDNQFFMYDPDTDVYRLIDDTEIDSTYQIRGLWWSTQQKAVYGVAFTTPQNYSPESNILFFKYDGTAFTVYTPTGETTYLTKALSGVLTSRLPLNQVAAGTWLGVYSAQSIEGGENVSLPFTQNVQKGYALDAGFQVYTETDGEADDIFDNIAPNVLLADGVTSQTIRRGFFRMGSAFTDTATKHSSGITFSWGQRNLVSFYNDTFYFFAQIGSNTPASEEHPRFMKFSTATGAVSTVISPTNLVENSKNLYPLCITPTNDGNICYFGSIAWYEGNDANEKSLSYIHKITLSTGTITNYFTGSGSDSINGSLNYFTPIELMFDHATPSQVFASMFQRDIAFSGFGYSIWNIGLGTRTKYTQTISATPWYGFARGISDTSIMYAVRAGAGTLYSIIVSGGDAGNVNILDDGFPIVETDFFLSAGLVVDNQTTSGIDVVWGVSAPYYDEWTQEVRQTGKYLLFKYDTRILGKIELADFEGLSAWDALTLLAEVANCNMGFDVHGNFFFIKRGEINSTDDYTFSHDDYSPQVVEIDEDDGREEVFNYSTITPSFVKFEQPSYEALMVERVSGDEDADTANEDEVLLKQTDQKRKSVRIICVQEGNANCGDGLTGYPKFKYLVYETTISARLAEDIEASETDLTLGSVFGGTNDENGIHQDDYIIFTNPTDDSEEIRRIIGGSGGADSIIDPDDNIVYISSAIGFPLKRNDEITIQRRFRRSSTDNIGNRWSDDGITFVTATATSATHTFSSVRNLSVNTVVVIGSNERRITAINDATNSVTLDSSASLTSGETVKAYWSPDNSGEYFEIGGTDVWIKIDCGVNKALFKRGDSITITCPGLSIEKDEMSKQTAYDTTSVSIYGKKLYPTIENRFMTRKIAQIKAKEIVAEYKNAVMVLTISIPFSPYLNLITETGNKLTRVGVTSRKFFPTLPNHKVSGYIRKITHSTQAGQTALEIRGITPY